MHGGSRFFRDRGTRRGRPANERYRLAGGYGGYRHGRKPSAALQVAAAHQDKSQSLSANAVHGGCITVYGKQGSDINARFWEIEILSQAGELRGRA